MSHTLPRIWIELYAAKEFFDKPVRYELILKLKRVIASISEVDAGSHVARRYGASEAIV